MESRPSDKVSEPWETFPVGSLVKVSSPIVFLKIDPNNIRGIDLKAVPTGGSLTTSYDVRIADVDDAFVIVGYADQHADTQRDDVVRKRADQKHKSYLLCALFEEEMVMSWARFTEHELESSLEVINRSDGSTDA
jgi:hypothetical protein